MASHGRRPRRASRGGGARWPRSWPQGVAFAQLADQFDVHPNQITTWKASSFESLMVKEWVAPANRQRQSPTGLDQAQNDVATALADVAEAEANHAAAVARPTQEQRTIADAQVKAAASALAVLERRLEKTVLHAPADGVVSVIVTEVGENIRLDRQLRPQEAEPHAINVLVLKLCCSERRSQIA
jgi:multidrug efflux pump subunit AcrA (membrane-fusion protein)